MRCMKLNENFKKFRETGKIEHYLKYKEEISKELSLKEKKDGKSKDKRDSSRKS